MPLRDQEEHAPAPRPEWPGFVGMVLGIVSAACSYVATGIDYWRWEASDELVCETPTWIVVWQFGSLALIVFGVAYIIWAARVNSHR